MGEKSLHILLVDDDEAHAKAVRREFESLDRPVHVKSAATISAARKILEQVRPDLVITDWILPDGKGLDLLSFGKGNPLFPLIVLTSRGNEQVAVDAMKAGALDYLIKSEKVLTELPHIVRRVLHEWEHMRRRMRTEADSAESHERFRAVFDSVSDCVFIKNRNLQYTHVNPAMCILLGLSEHQVIGHRAEDLFGFQAGRQMSDRHARVLEGESLEIEQTRPIRGQAFIFHDTVVPLRNNSNEIIGICGISRNVTERRKLADAPQTDIDEYPSNAMQATMDTARMAANADNIILLLGESGCGKDYLARWIHNHSRRASGPFFSINRAAVSKELAESELFGHEQGAFTGAAGLKKGMLELAEGGTILLNEIGELEASLQSKLLAFLDTKTFLRVGGQKELHVNARLIAATHRDLNKEVDEERFLKPLFYRLSVFPIHIPPLRKRIQDIPVLAAEILSTLASELQLAEFPLLQSKHLEALSQHRWPGNIRELRNVLERSLMLSQDKPLELSLPEAGMAETGPTYTVSYSPGTTIREVLDNVKSFMCAAALEHSHGNKRKAAKSLHISRDAFYRHIKKTSRKSRHRTASPKHALF